MRKVGVRIFLLRLASIMWIASGFLGGCRSTVEKDLTTISGHHAAMAAQATPTEIQAAVMAFADKFTSRAADVFDQLHDQAQTPELRVYARQAKINLGLGAATIACEINPVAALLDMVALTRLQHMSFKDHWASTLPAEHAENIEAMYQHSEQDVWLLAGRFLTTGQSDQLREIIDTWYRANPNARFTSHVRLIDFASYRRESMPREYSPGNVLSLLRIDPMAGMDPLARGIQETRLFAERTLFLAQRISPLVTWQAQRLTVDIFATPEVRSVLATTDKLGAVGNDFANSAERFNTTAERVAETFDRMPKDIDRVIEAAIDRSSAAMTEQREALTRDIDAHEQRARELLAEVNGTLAKTEAAVSGIGETANRTVQTAQGSSKEVIDHAFWRAIWLLLFIIVGIPVAMISYRYASSHWFSDHHHSEGHKHELT